MESLTNQNQPGDLFRNVSLLTRNLTTRHLTIKDDTVRVLTLKNEIVSRWLQYYKTLMTASRRYNPEYIEINAGQIEPIILKCVVEAAL